MASKNLYAVVGNPITHSLSPKLHQIFAERTQQVMGYTKYEIPKDEFKSMLPRLIQQGLKGFNVTQPFKQEAFDWVDECSAEAEKIGAVNTITVLPNGKTRGWSTDGVGLVRDLQQSFDFKIQDKKILLLGAGGAARSVIPALLDQGCSEIVIVNRTLEKAKEVAKLFDLLAYDWAELSSTSSRFDLVINATSLDENFPHVPGYLIDEGSLCYEMMYGRGLTGFLAWGKTQGAKISDGLGMLIEQGAESFYLWHGVRPETVGIQALLR